MKVAKIVIDLIKSQWPEILCWEEGKKQNQSRIQEESISLTAIEFEGWMFTPKYVTMTLSK